MRLGVVGYGRRMASVVTHHLRKAAPELRVVGIVDPDEEGVRERLEERDPEEVSFYATLDNLVRDAKPDALAIGTRCNLHAPYAVQAAAYDLPLYLEKPVAITMEQATALEDAFENSRCQVVVSFPLRVSPLCVMARQLIGQGAVGTPEHVAADNYVPYGTVYWEAPYRDYSITGGLFLQKATHDFDYITFLMDSPIVRVGAMWTRGHIFGGDKPAGLRCSECDEADDCPESPANRIRNGSASWRRGDHPCVFSVDCGSPEAQINEDSSSALLEFGSGAHGVYTQVFYTRRDAARRGATVSGYDGTVGFDWYRNELRRVRHHAPFSDTVRPDGSMSHFGGDDELARDFVRVVGGSGRTRTPIEAGIQSVYACLGARESAETGEFVEVRQVGASRCV